MRTHPSPRHPCSQLHAPGLVQPKPRLTSATFHSLPKPQRAASQLGTKLGCSLPLWLNFHHPQPPTPSSPLLLTISHTLKQNISFFHPCISVSNCSAGEIVLLSLLHDQVKPKWLRPQQQWIKMTKSCWNVNEVFQILLPLNIVLFSYCSGFVFIKVCHVDRGKKTCQQTDYII